MLVVVVGIVTGGWFVGWLVCCCWLRLVVEMLMLFVGSGWLFLVVVGFLLLVMLFCGISLSRRVLGCSWAGLGVFRVALGPLLAGLGSSLWVSGVALGRSWGFLVDLVVSWVAFGAIWSRSWVALGGSWAALGRS